jgi:hypothetical protein
MGANRAGFIKTLRRYLGWGKMMAMKCCRHREKMNEGTMVGDISSLPSIRGCLANEQESLNPGNGKVQSGINLHLRTYLHVNIHNHLVSPTRVKWLALDR